MLIYVLDFYIQELNEDPQQLMNSSNKFPYLIAVGENQNDIRCFYIAIENQIITVTFEPFIIGFEQPFDFFIDLSYFRSLLILCSWRYLIFFSNCITFSTLNIIRILKTCWFFVNVTYMNDSDTSVTVDKLAQKVLANPK